MAANFAKLSELLRLKGLKLLVRFSGMPASATVIAVVGVESLSQANRPWPRP